MLWFIISRVNAAGQTTLEKNPVAAEARGRFATACPSWWVKCHLMRLIFPFNRAGTATLPFFSRLALLSVYTAALQEGSAISKYLSVTYLTKRDLASERPLRANTNTDWKKV